MLVFCTVYGCEGWEEEEGERGLCSVYCGVIPNYSAADQCTFGGHTFEMDDMHLVHSFTGPISDVARVRSAPLLIPLVGTMAGENVFKLEKKEISCGYWWTRRVLKTTVWMRWLLQASTNTIYLAAEPVNLALRKRARPGTALKKPLKWERFCF